MIDGRLAVVLCALLFAGIASGDEVRLKSGDVLLGTVSQQSESAITLVHPLLGTLTLPRSAIELITFTPQSAAATTSTTSTPATAPASAGADPASPPRAEAGPQAPPAVIEEPKAFWEGWKGSVDAGVNGSDGNSETLSARGAIGARRITTSLETSASLHYVYVTDNGIKSKSRGELNLRNDWLMHPSPWGFFAVGKVEYDEFQAWDLRASLFVGPSYTFIQSEHTALRGRAGLGSSKEFGSVQNEITPEALFGLEWNHRLSDRSRLYASAEILPSLSNFPEHRINSQAGYELLVDPQTRMNVKFGVASRYDSDPSPTSDGLSPKSNDIEYFVTAGWDF